MPYKIFHCAKMGFLELKLQLKKAGCGPVTQ